MKRFLVLALFCAGNLMNEFMQLTFSPIFASTQAVFGVSAAAVTLLPTLYLAAFAPAALALALLRARWGLRACMLAGAGVQALGALLRYAACALAARAPARGAFPLLAAGQLLAALAQPIFTNLPAVLSATWFAAAQRALATVFATISNPIGNALGSALPALVVPDVPPGASPAAAAAALARLTLAQFLAAALVAAAVWAWVEDEPAEPPSAAAALRRAAAAARRAAAADDAAAGDAGADDAAAGAAAAAGDAAEAPSAALLAPAAARAAAPAPGAWAALRRDYAALLRDSNFVRLLVGFGVGLGIFNALLALLGQLLAPCGYAPSVAGLAGGAMLASGLFSAVGAGVALRATGFFVPALRVGIACAALGMVNFLLALRPGGAAALLAASAVLGAAAVPLLPLTLENAAELTFPIAEDSSASLLTSAGKLAGVVFVLILQPLVGRGACATVLTPAAGVVAGAIGCSALVLLSFRADYRRAAAERGADEAAAAAECGAGGAAAA
jgi:hypothetical protein